MKFLGKWWYPIMGLVIFAFFLMRVLSFFEAMVLIQLFFLNETIEKYVKTKK